jgi:hypothetical protein
LNDRSLSLLALPTENLAETRSRAKANLNTSTSVSPTPSDQSRVRQMIVRLESSVASPATKTDKKVPMKKPLHEDHSDGTPSSTSSPPIKRVARREYAGTNLVNTTDTSKTEDGVVYQLHDLSDDVFFDTQHSSSSAIKFDFSKEDMARNCQRTASGATVSSCLSNCVSHL